MSGGKDRDLREVEEYFGRTAGRFENIYTGAGGPGQRLFDRIFRPDMRRRFELALERCPRDETCRVLDVGCGPGHYTTALARRGRGEVWGVDLSAEMLRLARLRADRFGVSRRVRLVEGDFMAWEPKSTFRVSLAMGVTDYLADPVPLLERMKSFTTDRMLLSFPTKSAVREPLRKMRLRLAGCPVYFYDARDIARILSRLGNHIFEVIKIPGSGSDYFVAVYL